MAGDGEREFVGAGPSVHGASHGQPQERRVEIVQRGAAGGVLRHGGGSGSPRRPGRRSWDAGSALGLPETPSGRRPGQGTCRSAVAGYAWRSSLKDQCDGAVRQWIDHHAINRNVTIVS